MKPLRLTLSIVTICFGGFAALYGAMGSLFVANANDGTPKIDALWLVGVALVGAILTFLGFRSLIRKPR